MAKVRRAPVVFNKRKKIGLKSDVHPLILTVLLLQTGVFIGWGTTGLLANNGGGGNVVICDG